MSVLAISPLFAFWGGLFWSLGAIVLFVVGLILVGVILIQDSNEGGLGGSFGGGMSGEIMGVHGQRDINRFTAFAAIVFAVLMIALGLSDSIGQPRALEGDESTVPPQSTTTQEPGGQEPVIESPSTSQEGVLPQESDAKAPAPVNGTTESENESN